MKDAKTNQEKERREQKKEEQNFGTVFKTACEEIIERKALNCETKGYTKDAKACTYSYQGENFIKI